MTTRHAMFASVMILGLLASGAVASSEVLRLKDGSIIVGRITGVDDSLISVSTAFGDFAIDKTKVQSVIYADSSSEFGLQNPVEAPAMRAAQKSALEDYGQLGRLDGAAEGFSDGYKKGREDQRQRRISSSLVAWGVTTVLGILVYLYLLAQ